MRSLGFVEVSGVVAAVDALDIMCKTASVNLVTWERKLGGRLVTLVVEGSVSDVTEAIEAAKANCISRVRAA
ncbi:MAG: BMC domain-containing protein, partial [Clostridia bacterium]|nr:BMC domain-containing protein [Clostridia bacterium]